MISAGSFQPEIKFRWCRTVGCRAPEVWLVLTSVTGTRVCLTWQPHLGWYEATPTPIPCGLHTGFILIKDKVRDAISGSLQVRERDYKVDPFHIVPHKFAVELFLQSDQTSPFWSDVPELRLRYLSSDHLERLVGSTHKDSHPYHQFGTLGGRKWVSSTSLIYTGDEGKEEGASSSIQKNFARSDGKTRVLPRSLTRGRSHSQLRASSTSFNNLKDQKEASISSPNLSRAFQVAVDLSHASSKFLAGLSSTSSGVCLGFEDGSEPPSPDNKETPNNISPYAAGGETSQDSEDAGEGARRKKSLFSSRDRSLRIEDLTGEEAWRCRREAGAKGFDGSNASSTSYEDLLANISSTRRATFKTELNLLRFDTLAQERLVKEILAPSDSDFEDEEGACEVSDSDIAGNYGCVITFESRSSSMDDVGSPRALEEVLVSLTSNDSHPEVVFEPSKLQLHSSDEEHDSEFNLGTSSSSERRQPEPKPRTAIPRSCSGPSSLINKVPVPSPPRLNVSLVSETLVSVESHNEGFDSSLDSSQVHVKGPPEGDQAMSDEDISESEARHRVTLQGDGTVTVAALTSDSRITPDIAEDDNFQYESLKHEDEHIPIDIRNIDSEDSTEGVACKYGVRYDVAEDEACSSAESDKDESERSNLHELDRAESITSSVDREIPTDSFSAIPLEDSLKVTVREADLTGTKSDEDKDNESDSRDPNSDPSEQCDVPKSCDHPKSLLNYSEYISVMSKSTEIQSGSESVEATSGVVSATASTLAGDDRARTLMGDDRARTLTGDDRARTVTGDDRARTLMGDDRARTLTGDDRASTLTGDDRARTLTGDDRARTSTGDDRARTVTGDDRARTLTGDDRARTLTGDDRARTLTGDDRARTLTGDDRARTLTGDDRARTLTGDDRARTLTGDDHGRNRSSIDDNRDRISRRNARSKTYNVSDRSKTLTNRTFDDRTFESDDRGRTLDSRTYKSGDTNRTLDSRTYKSGDTNRTLDSRTHKSDDRDRHFYGRTYKGGDKGRLLYGGAHTDVGKNRGVIGDERGVSFADVGKTSAGSDVSRYETNGSFLSGQYGGDKKLRASVGGRRQGQHPPGSATSDQHPERDAESHQPHLRYVRLQNAGTQTTQTKRTSKMASSWTYKFNEGEGVTVGSAAKYSRSPLRNGQTEPPFTPLPDRLSGPWSQRLARGPSPSPANADLAALQRNLYNLVQGHENTMYLRQLQNGLRHKAYLAPHLSQHIHPGSVQDPPPRRQQSSVNPPHHHESPVKHHCHHPPVPNYHQSPVHQSATPIHYKYPVLNSTFVQSSSSLAYFTTRPHLGARDGPPPGDRAAGVSYGGSARDLTRLHHTNTFFHHRAGAGGSSIRSAASLPDLQHPASSHLRVPSQSSSFSHTNPGPTHAHSAFDVMVGSGSSVGLKGLYWDESDSGGSTDSLIDEAEHITTTSLDPNIYNIYPRIHDWDMPNRKHHKQRRRRTRSHQGGFSAWRSEADSASVGTSSGRPYLPYRGDQLSPGQQVKVLAPGGGVAVARVLTNQKSSWQINDKIHHTSAPVSSASVTVILLSEPNRLQGSVVTVPLEKVLLAWPRIYKTT